MESRKFKVLICMALGLMLAPNICYASDYMDEEYVIGYDFENKKTTYYGYDQDKHDFFEVQEPAVTTYNKTVSEGTADIAYIDDEEYAWVKAGNIYIDKKSVKEDEDNPYTIIFSADNVPIVYKCDKSEKESWNVVDQSEVILLSGTIKQIDDTTIVFTDEKERDFKVSIKEKEDWEIGDQIRVIGSSKINEKEGTFDTVYGYFRVKEEE